MKAATILLVFIAVTISQGYCQSKSDVDSIIRKELKSGMITDTAFMNFCFGDSPEIIHTKLSSSIKKGNIIVDSKLKLKSNSFPTDDVLNKGKWRMSFKYANEDLSEVYIFYFPSIKDLKSDENISVINLKDAMNKKYGTCSVVDSTSKPEYTEYDFYWIKNNFKAHLFGRQSKTDKPNNMLIVTYSDTRYDKITIYDNLIH